MPDVPLNFRKYLSTAIALLLVTGCFARAAEREIDPNAMPLDLDRGTAGLIRVLAELRTRASILMITAHPDDEDGGMLAAESRGRGARATLLTLNRGEGGQNAMSTEMYDELGLVRTPGTAAGRPLLRSRPVLDACY